MQYWESVLRLSGFLVDGVCYICLIDVDIWFSVAEVKEYHILLILYPPWAFQLRFCKTTGWMNVKAYNYTNCLKLLPAMTKNTNSFIDSG